MLLVSTANPNDLAAAIERARVVKTGYNYIPSPTTTSEATSTATKQEVDELTKKLEQLTLLASIFTV